MKINYKDLPKTSKTPVLTYCRKLVSEGVDPDTKLEIFREHDDPDLTVINIGEAAKLGISEEPRTRFIKYAPPV